MKSKIRKILGYASLPITYPFISLYRSIKNPLRINRHGFHIIGIRPNISVQMKQAEDLNRFWIELRTRFDEKKAEKQ